MTTTSPITGSSTSTTSSGNSTVTNPSLNLNPTDFLKLMITQLQNQDPFQPADSNQLLSQMSEIGQLQASDTMQSSLTSMTLQNQIGAASGLLGKYVTGTDAGNATVAGTVDGIQVTTTGVSLQLDSGSTVGLGNVTSIAPAITGNATSSAITVTPGNATTPTMGPAAASGNATPSTITVTPGSITAGAAPS